MKAFFCVLVPTVIAIRKERSSPNGRAQEKPTPNQKLQKQRQHVLQNLLFRIDSKIEMPKYMKKFENWL